MIKQVKKKKILGIIVDEKFTFKSHIKYICTILPIDIRLQELNRMECLELLRKNDNALKDKLIASFRNLKPYPSPLHNLAKQDTRILSHLTV